MIRSTLQTLAAGLVAGVLATTSVAQSNAPAAGSAPASSTVDKMTQLFGDEVVAKGQGFEIKRSQLDSALMSFKANAAARNQTVSPLEMTRVEQQLLQQLIRVHMLLAKATPEDRAKGKEDGEKRLQALLKQAGSEEKFVRQLKSAGMSLDELKARLAEEGTAESVVTKEIPVTITDDEVKKFYEDNPSRFEEPEMVRVSHILLATMDQATRQPLPTERREAKRKQIDDLLKRAKDGEDFAKLAKEYSEDPGSKERDGEYNFTRGQMVPEFEAAAFSLGVGQISEVVTTQFGYHIIKLLEKTPAKKVPFDKVSEQLKDGLRQQAIQKQLPDYFKKRRETEKVEILDEKLKLPEADAGSPATKK